MIVHWIAFGGCVLNIITLDSLILVLLEDVYEISVHWIT